MKHILILIGIGFAVGILFGIFHIPFNFWMMVGLLIVAFFALSYRDIRYMFFSRNIEKIEKYLAKKRQEPYYGFILELANGNMQEAKEELEALEEKWKGKKTAVFRAQYYLKAGNTAKAKEEVEFIHQQEIKNYVLAAIAAAEKDVRKAEEWKQTLKKDWMKLAIETELAIEKKDFSLAKEKKEQTLAAVKGLQYYIIYKEFQNI